MIHKLYSVHDAKAELYDPPKAFRSRGLALREFSNAVNKKGHPFNTYPADYHFFEIGEYDDCTAQMKIFDVKENLGCAIDFVDSDLARRVAEITPEERVQ